MAFLFSLCSKSKREGHGDGEVGQHLVVAHEADLDERVPRPKGVEAGDAYLEVGAQGVRTAVRDADGQEAAVVEVAVEGREGRAQVQEPEGMEVGEEVGLGQDAVGVPDDRAQLAADVLIGAEGGQLHLDGGGTEGRGGLCHGQGQVVGCIVGLDLPVAGRRASEAGHLS